MNSAHRPFGGGGGVGAGLGVTASRIFFSSSKISCSMVIVKTLKNHIIKNYEHYTLNSISFFIKRAT
jgi:hypothetical protein